MFESDDNLFSIAGDGDFRVLQVVVELFCLRLTQIDVVVLLQVFMKVSFSFCSGVNSDGDHSNQTDGSKNNDEEQVVNERRFFIYQFKSFCYCAEEDEEDCNDAKD